MARQTSSLAKTIREQRATIREQRAECAALRAENERLSAKNRAPADTEELRERVSHLEKLLRDPIEDLWNLPLTMTKSRMLGILYRSPGVVPRERMDFALHGMDSTTDLKCIDVHLVGLRRQLKPHGITIETIWGRGYQLTPESRPRLAAMIEKQRRAAANATQSINGAHQGEQHVGNV